MRYLFIVMLVASLFILRPDPAAASNGTLYSCLPDELQWCSYDGSSVWDTIVTYSYGAIDSGESEQPDCSSSTGCYIIAEETSSTWLCVDYEVSGTMDCENTACIGYDDSGAISWTGGGNADAYKCVDNECVAE